MGKKKTTNVTQTGLGDGQFDTLSGNQANLAATLDQQNTDAAAANKALLAGQEGIQTGVDGLQTSQTAGFEANALAAENARLEAIEREKRLQESIGNISFDTSGLESGIAGLGTSVDAGFDTMGGRFDTVDTNLSTANQGIVDANTGIAALTKGQTAMQGDITSGFETSAENQANLTAGQLEYYEKAKLERDALQKAVLEGQVTIQDLVNKYGADGAKYYEALSGVQSQLMEGQSGLQTGLTAFQDQYTQDFQDQGKFLGELKNSVTGGFDTTNRNLAETTGNLGQNLSTVNTNIGNLGTTLGNSLSTGFSGVSEGQLTAEQLQAGFENNSTEDFDYGQIATEIYTATEGLATAADISSLEVTTADGQTVLADQIADGTALIDGSVKEGNRILSADQVKMRDAFVTKLDQVNNIITSQDSQLSTELRQQYMNLSASFDEKGALISESVDENGIRTNRAIDKQGNLILAQFDAQGKRISQSSMNINDLIKGLDQGPRYNAGTNYQMGNPSPAYNERYGLMGPYTSTAGAPQYGTTPPRAVNTQGVRTQFTPLAGGQ